MDASDLDRVASAYRALLTSALKLHPSLTSVEMLEKIRDSTDVFDLDTRASS